MRKLGCAAIVIVLLSLNIIHNHLEQKNQDDIWKCHGNLNILGKTIKTYVETYGCFPGSQESKDSWFRDLKHMCDKKHIWPSSEFDSFLKCPFDKSSTSTSYEMNTAWAGRNPDDDPHPALTPLLTEKPNHGIHRWVLYADGHVGRFKK